MNSTVKFYGLKDSFKKKVRGKFMNYFIEVSVCTRTKNLPRLLVSIQSCDVILSDIAKKLKIM